MPGRLVKRRRRRIHSAWAVCLTKIGPPIGKRPREIPYAAPWRAQTATRGVGSADTQRFDDFKIGIDNNADGDILDGGDDVQIDDDFNSGVVSLAYDDNGNLMDDGVYLCVYDAWNRLRKATRRVDS